jgi:hypothetical protein
MSYTTLKILYIVGGLYLLTLLNNSQKNEINKAMNSWMNYHYSSLLSAWGNPTNIYNDGAGGLVIVYSYTTTVPLIMPKSKTRTYGTGNIRNDEIFIDLHSTTTYTPGYTMTIKKYRIFFVNKDGIIYKNAWKGL